MKLITLLFSSLLAVALATEDEPKIKYVTPVPSGDVHFAEPFDADDALESWELTSAEKKGVEEDLSKYTGRWEVEAAMTDALEGDTGLVMKDKARHHAIAAKLDKPFVFDDKSFVLQYEVNFQEGVECAGAYLKLLRQSDDLKLDEFQNQTPYTIMFGPDKCGESYKVHFIFQHKNPLTGKYEEKHMEQPANLNKEIFTDKQAHLYTLVVNPDNSFAVYVDQQEVQSGNLLTDMTPPVNPPKQIEDPDDVKPENWDERETIPDPEATKPDDWDEEAPQQIVDSSAEMPNDWLEDEPQTVDDPDAEMPDDWDEEIDGEWEAPQVDNPACASVSGCGLWEPPMIDNPEFKGKWKAPHISNPGYQGIWKPRMIDNPDFFEDLQPFKMHTIAAVGIELWTMTANIMFDNIMVTSDKTVADEYAMRTYGLKKMHVKDNNASLMSSLVDQANEKPWLYAVYILVIVLPLIFLITWCCKSSPKDKVAEMKKTDAASPDDQHDSEEEEIKDEASQKEASDAEEEAVDDVTTADNDVTKAEESEKEELGGGDNESSAAEEEEVQEEVEEEVAAEKEAGDATSSPRATRRRKPRKDD